MIRVVLTTALLLVTPELLLNAVPAQDRPLPDPETFYRIVRQNLTRAERSQHLFTYRNAVRIFTRIRSASLARRNERVPCIRRRHGD